TFPGEPFGAAHDPSGTGSFPYSPAENHAHDPSTSRQGPPGLPRLVWPVRTPLAVLDSRPAGLRGCGSLRPGRPAGRGIDEGTASRAGPPGQGAGRAGGRTLSEKAVCRSREDDGAGPENQRTAVPKGDVSLGTR